MFCDGAKRIGRGVGFAAALERAAETEDIGPSVEGLAAPLFGSREALVTRPCP
jgi:hypothetical protein